MIRAVLQTMVYMRDPKNHRELVDYVLKIHKIDAAVAAEALATVMAVYSKDGTKPRGGAGRDRYLPRGSQDYETLYTRGIRRYWPS